MTKLEQLREQAKAKTMEAINIAREKAETNRLQAIINGNLASIIAKQEVAADTSNKLKSLEEQCVQLVQTLPVYSKATRELRKFNPSRVYGFGNQIASLVGILSGIQYSANEHKLQMLAQTGLNEQIIEDTLNAFGAPAYFSEKYDVIVSIKNSVQNINNYLNTAIFITRGITSLNMRFDESFYEWIKQNEIDRRRKSNALADKIIREYSK